jgi:hypothetical protein
MRDKYLFMALGILLLVPIGFAVFSQESFRYPCQDPGNWEKANVPETTMRCD